MLKAEERAIRWAIRGRNVLKSGKADQRACTYGYLCFGWCLAGLTEKALNLLFFTKSPLSSPNNISFLFFSFYWVPSIGFSRRWDPIPSFTSQQSMQVDLCECPSHPFSLIDEHREIIGYASTHYLKVIPGKSSHKEPRKLFGC